MTAIEIIITAIWLIICLVVGYVTGEVIDRIRHGKDR